jgi:hypothetical protein
VREVRGEEEDGCGGGRDGGRGAGGDNEVEIPNEVTGGRGTRNRRRARGGKADAVDGDNVDPSPLLSRHRHRCATTFSAHRCAAIADTTETETTTMETTTATMIDDDSDNEGDTDGNRDDGDGNNGNDDYFSHNILHYYNMVHMVIVLLYLSITTVSKSIDFFLFGDISLEGGDISPLFFLYLIYVELRGEVYFTANHNYNHPSVRLASTSSRRSLELLVLGARI